MRHAADQVLRHRPTEAYRRIVGVDECGAVLVRLEGVANGSPIGSPGENGAILLGAPLQIYQGFNRAIAAGELEGRVVGNLDIAPAIEGSGTLAKGSIGASIIRYDAFQRPVTG